MTAVTKQQIYDKQYYFKNRAKRLIAAQNWRKNNKERMRALTKAWHKANPLRLLNLKLKSKYGITLTQYNELLKQQNNRCAICNRHKNKFDRKLSIDHNHKTRQVRGLLCASCNRGIGYFFENVKLLDNAKEYLIKWSK